MKLPALIAAIALLLIALTYSGNAVDNERDDRAAARARAEQKDCPPMWQPDCEGFDD